MDTKVTGPPTIVEGLLDPAAYPEPVPDVELVETHVSYLFFAGRHVYKVKKPVNYGFLDFTTLEKRLHFCRREVELNGRLSPDVYLGVVPIVRRGDRLSVEASGEPVEYAVKMVRLPRDRSLDNLLRAGQVSAEDLGRVAARVASFHRRAETGPHVTRLGSLEAVRGNMEENFRQIRPYVDTCLTGDEFDDLEMYSRAFMDACAPLFRRREAAGRIRDGHGDLHSANIFLEDGIHFIDCIEFNDRFRCLDVAEDVAFLAMDLDFFCRPDLSDAFIAAYIEASGDEGLLAMLDFYKCYRACVRGKVTAFRLEGSLDPAARSRVVQQARAYFRLARRYTRIFPRPSLVLMTGLMGTGKTYHAQELARRWDMVHVSSDVTRKALAGLAATERRFEAYGAGIYSPEFSRRTYEAMRRTAREHLAHGRSVVLDATFRYARERRLALEVARETGAEAWVVECVAPPQLVRGRLTRRLEEGTSASDARWELYSRQRDEWEPVAELPPHRHIRLDTSGEKGDSVRRLLYLLFRGALGCAPSQG